MTRWSLERRLAWSGGLIAAGLAVEVGVSAWIHPLAFITFAVVACPLVGGGMALAFWSMSGTRQGG